MKMTQFFLYEQELIHVQYFCNFYTKKIDLIEIHIDFLTRRKINPSDKIDFGSIAVFNNHDYIEVNFFAFQMKKNMRKINGVRQVYKPYKYFVAIYSIKEWKNLPFDVQNDLIWHAERNVKFINGCIRLYPKTQEQYDRIKYREKKRYGKTVFKLKITKKQIEKVKLHRQIILIHRLGWIIQEEEFYFDDTYDIYFDSNQKMYMVADLLN
jgi:hypothetical protein